MNQNENALVLFQYLQWLQQVFDMRLLHYFKKKDETIPDVQIPTPPSPQYPELPLAAFIRQHQLDIDHQLLLITGLAPHISPDFYNLIVGSYISKGEYPLLGMIRGDQFRGFMPTGETALFIIAGVDLSRRLEVQHIFDPDAFFSKQQVLRLETAQEGDPAMTGKISVSTEFVDKFLTGSITRPRFGPDFPAERISTPLDWEDLVLPQETMEQVSELKKWMYHKNRLSSINKRLKLGFRALFYGPPGTGKTLTACLLGKRSAENESYGDYDVYRIDLSLVVSKFIGETEKNLSKLFDKAEQKNWILFFDEADALFGKRTSVRDAHDKYANQEVAYLLQKIENYNGLIILASNFRTNIDPAFTRRFQSVIHFAMPSRVERLKLWEGIFSPDYVQDKDLLEAISAKYELSGASILNVAQVCFLKNLNKQGKVESITKSDIENAIEREFNKEGRILK